MVVAVGSYRREGRREEGESVWCWQEVESTEIFSVLGT